ncbi:hypothetical protein BDK51DRAFT_45537 [Blyttiomyces helicus]|uniref:Uncharacterized protein n=1 Tax=Blyttiomyces helicus TaxID=388810 RepID=A0A4P9VZJ0_9FUNG|nr:hypothetical protein BDK51DRAFT_45537 [Blyttiomyces helicus]|eukprot:RKO85239.1 hypothetical protein BDK51DRAFT_45537 [Blyttiomyces helicus]
MAPVPPTVPLTLRGSDQAHTFGLGLAQVTTPIDNFRLPTCQTDLLEAQLARLVKKTFSEYPTMAVESEEQPEAAQYLTGNFTTDYPEACRRNNVQPLTLLHIGFPLPPIPIAQTPPLRDSSPFGATDLASDPDPATSSVPKTTRSISSNLELNSPFSGSLISEPDPRSASVSASVGMLGPVGIPVRQMEPRKMNYDSRYRFTPTLVVETLEGEEEDEANKVEIRGWKVAVGNIVALAAAVTACSSIAQLV